MAPPLDEAEAVARHRFMILNLARVGGIALLIAGIAGVRNALPLPYALAVVLALAGFFAFFFGPTFLVRRWKSQDNSQ